MITDYTNQRVSYRLITDNARNGSRDFEIRTEAGALIAQTFELIGRHRQSVDAEANALRIVLCLNLFMGINTATLCESKDLASAFISADTAKLTAQQNQLVTSLKDILARFESCIEGGIDFQCDAKAIKTAKELIKKCGAS